MLRQQRCNLCRFLAFLLPASEGWGKVIFSVCSYLWGGGGGYPLPRSRWGYPFPGPGKGSRGWGTPIQVRSQGGGGGGEGQGVSPPRSDPRMGVGGTPYQNSIVCTCYTADGMPLAFTQEDCLVIHVSSCNHMT